MTDEEYARYIEKNLRDFWKPGQRLKITKVFRAHPKARIHCALCEWPRTSKNPTSEGLKNVFVLKSLDTGAWRFIGCKCADRYQEHLRKMAPDFKITGMKKAKQRLKKLQIQARKQARAQGPSPDATPNNSYHSPQ